MPPQVAEEKAKFEEVNVRLEATQGQLKEMAAQRDEQEERAKRAEFQVAELQAQQQQLRDRIEELEILNREAAERIAEAERRVAEAERQLAPESPVQPLNFLTNLQVHFIFKVVQRMKSQTLSKQFGIALRITLKMSIIIWFPELQGGFSLAPPRQGPPCPRSAQVRKARPPAEI